jgi:uncharacterized repeat protein (TIGR02543 family)
MRVFSFVCGILALVAVAVLPVGAQPVINEFMASNLSTAPDNWDFEDYSDWIELYNPAGTSVALTNYYLTDDLTQPFKWLVPTNAAIAAHGYLMFRADGFDAAPGETHLRGYWPWGSTFVTRRYHTGFKLSADGEALGLYRSTLPPQDVTLIATGAVWHYRDTGTNPGTNWMSSGYVDAGWAQGAAQLGYGEGDEATVVSGANASSNHLTTQFRKHFAVTDPARLGNIRCRVVVDDGAVLYLNGTEFARLRMNAGPITYTNLANANPPAENAWETVELPRSLFVAGDNVLAAEVHQVTANSSDLSWAAELIAAEITGPAELVDSVTFGVQTTDVSFGRNATNGWSWFGTPTPEGPNVTGTLTDLKPAPSLTASLPSGFYTNAQSVSLDCTGAVTAVRYTLDGSVPGPDSPVYSNAVAIAANTILRARAFVTGWIPGPILTRSYFVGEPADRTLPVLSFVVDPATFFDGIIGIYTNNGSYPHKGREVPVRVEFFETNQASAFAVNAGVRIGGENNWPYAQKPLNIHMRGKYGDDVINYPVFPGEPFGTYGKLNIRNGGDTWTTDMLRDAMMSPILRGQAQTDPTGYRPTVVFINGRYWGIQDIRKMFDPVFFATEHHLAADTYDLVEYAHDYSQATDNVALMADTGTIDAYEDFHAFYTTHAMSQATNYAAMQEKMNVDSFIDYVVVNDFGVNTSWPWNREFWCGRAPGSKWQWNIPDLDRCFDTNSVAGSLIDDFRSGYPLFKALTNNPAFVDRLLQRYAAHLGSTLYSNRMTTVLNQLSAEQDGEMPRHIARWAAQGGIPSLASRQTALDKIKKFFVARPAPAVSRLQTELGLNRGLAKLAVTVSPADGGNLRIAGVPMTPQYNTDMALFKNTPVELTAEAAPGYAFIGWSTGSTNPTIELTLTADQSITANFQPGAETVLPSGIAADTTLTAANSPYTLAGDLIVASNTTLTLGPGVKLLLPPGASIYVYGALQVNGTTNAPVEMLARSGQPWGNLCFVNATGGSVLSHLTLRGASASRLDPVNYRAAVSALNSAVTLDGADIDASLPIFARGGSITLRNSRIHVRFTGDGINLKSSGGLVENCTFTGEATPDTDAVDFDNVTNGVIRGNRIYAFLGSNSDAIDVGEGCQNLLVISNRIFNMFDKGVSVGQASVARIERNVIVDCGIGVGVKDFGSTALINQNTFAKNDVGVAVYEKNPGNGGGIAHVTNSIFSRSKTAPVTVDALSVLSVSYSLSDTLPLAGTGNLPGDPLFTDAGIYDFSLTAGSPALNSGDPAQPPDPDGTRVDMGACYAYSTNDYPFVVPNLVVVNEVMAHSHDAAPDWIELHNNSAQDLNLGGWWLSDDPATPMKFRIADGTLLPGGGYLVFSEDQHFGAASTNAGALIPFALSENGDSVNIFGPGDGLRPDYSEREDFGASATGVSFGRYFKASTRTYNFVSLAGATPGAANSSPLVGPVVISEIMYHPPVADAEYLELANITTNAVTLFDTNTATPWQMTQGITWIFPTNPPLTLAGGEKILLVRNSATFAANYTPPAGTRVFQWASGVLDNNGETLEIAKPGDVNDLGERQYIRVDRVDYSDAAPWPAGPDGGGTALARINERAYGNDVANWADSTATPGETGFQQWAAGQSFPAGQGGPNDDPDGDGLRNAFEYALGSNPLATSAITWHLTMSNAAAQVTFTLAANRPEVGYSIQKADDAGLTSWTNLNSSLAAGAGQTFVLSAQDPATGGAAFYRLAVSLFNQY